MLSSGLRRNQPFKIVGGNAGASGGRLEEALKVKRFWCSGEVEGQAER